MKMIEVLQLISEGKIKDQTTLEIYDPIDKLYTYTFNGKFKAFYSNTKYSEELSCYFKLNEDFLNFDVELIPPKEKKYLVKFNMRGLQERFTYLNYGKNSRYVHLHDKYGASSVQTEFTEDELQSIKSVREFLEDAEGKYELIEVKDNEID
ncbi:hypothetical protein CIRMBP1266_00792 [Enterococcus cecorum]|nr:hypothetical protein CIRMBP1266_00792 [Enterococcus cecorum]